RVQRGRRPPRPPRRRGDAVRVPRPAGEAARLPRTHGLDVPVGLLPRQRLQLRLRDVAHGGGAARRRLQLRAVRGHDRGGVGRGPHERGAGRDEPGGVPQGGAGDERVRALRRRRVPHLLGLCPRPGRPVGRLSVARPGTPGPQRGGERRMATARPLRAYDGGLTGVVALLGLAGAAWAVSVERMSGMDMGPGTDPGRLGWFVVTWVLMMAAMMLPALVPAARAGGASAAFVSGYLGVWTVAGVGAYALVEAVRAGHPGWLAWDSAGRW